MLEVPVSLVASLLDYLRHQCAASDDLWAANLLRHLELIGDPASSDRQGR